MLGTGLVGISLYRPGLFSTVLVLVGTAFAALTIGWFLLRQWGLPVRESAPAERLWYSREAAALLADLAPLILALREREQALESELLLVDDSKAWEVREALSRSGSRELWSVFARASALVEEDPKQALEWSRGLRPRLQECVTSLDDLLDRRFVSRTPVERGEGDGRA